MHFLFFVVSLFVLHASAQISIPGLPVFAVSTTTIILAPAEKVWDVLLDWEKYPEWNPFIRSQVLANDLLLPELDQSLASKKAQGKGLEGKKIIIRAQVPPLPLPANRTSLENLFNNQISFENITTIDHFLHILATEQVLLIPELLETKKLTTLSGALGLPLTIYSSTQAFYGPLASMVRDLYAAGYTDGFNRQGEALKARVESLG